MLEFIKTELGRLNFESSCKCFSFFFFFKSLFHKVCVNINKILVFLLLSSLFYLRTAGIFSTSNKEKNIRKLIRETCHF